jgi:hypothetical protein
MCKTCVVPWRDVPKSCYGLLARPAQPSGRSSEPMGIALAKLMQILEAGIAASGQSITEMSRRRSGPRSNKPWRVSRSR